MIKSLFRYSIILVSTLLVYGCSDYNRILEKVGDADQSVRQWVLNMSTLSPEEIATYSIKMVETDSLNRVAVANILDKDGWPKGLSDKANKAIWLVITHSDIDFQEKYLPLIESKANEGIVDKTGSRVRTPTTSAASLDVPPGRSNFAHQNACLCRGSKSSRGRTGHL